MSNFQALRSSAPTYCHLATGFGGQNGNPNYSKNADKPARTADGLRFQPDRSLCCVYCGKYCGSVAKFAVYLLNTSEISEAEHFAGEDGDNLCFYPIGGDCARKFKKLGIPVYDGQTFERL